MANDKILYRMGEITGAPEGEQMVIEGRAVVYDTPTVLFEWDGVQYKEQIARGALDGADMSRCVLRYNHNASVPLLARVRGGSLALTDGASGLDFRAELFDTQAARDCFELVRRGALQCSFAFTVKESKYDRKEHLSTITRIDTLYDVAIVDDPAYADTYVSARSREAFDAQLRERLMRRRRLWAKTF